MNCFLPKAKNSVFQSFRCLCLYSTRFALPKASRCWLAVVEAVGHASIHNGEY